MADERTNEDQPQRSNAVSLPAGSFNLQELEKSLDSAVGLKDEGKRQERINKAIVENIAVPEILASESQMAVPTGATVIDQELVYADGAEPVKSKGIAFRGAKGLDKNDDVTKMRYEERGGEVRVTDRPPGSPVPAGDDGDDRVTLAEQADEIVELEQPPKAPMKVAKDGEDK